MKKTYIAVAIFALLAMLGSPALAEDSKKDSSQSSSSRGAGDRERIQNLRKDLKEKRDETKAKIKEAREQKRDNEKAEKDKDKIENQAKRKEQLSSFWDKVSEKLGRLLENEDRYINRLKERLEKAASNGKDVTALNTKLEAAKKLVADARTAVKDAGSKVADIIKNNDAKVAREKIEALVKELREKIKAAHQVLVDINNSIKEGRGTKPSPSPSVSPKPSASPSPSPTSTQ